MALIHQATITPTKLELVEQLLSTRGWAPQGADELTQVAAYRFDDPAGEVGVETLLVRRGDGPVLQVPLAYRGAPTAGAEEHLVGTMEHSVLGRRWVYDACGDPVWAQGLATTVLTGGREAEEVVDEDGTLVPRRATAQVHGSGRPGTEVPVLSRPECRDGELTVVRAAGLELVLARVVGTAVTAEETLTGRWDGARDTVLAGVRRA